MTTHHDRRESMKTVSLSAHTKKTCSIFWAVRILVVVIVGTVMGNLISSYFMPMPFGEIETAVKHIQKNQEESTDWRQRQDKAIIDIQKRLSDIEKKQK